MTSDIAPRGRPLIGAGRGNNPPVEKCVLVAWGAEARVN